MKSLGHSECPKPKCQPDCHVLHRSMGRIMKISKGFAVGHL
jgi:hypothetical protein